MKMFRHCCLLLFCIGWSAMLWGQKVYRPFVPSNEVLPQWVSLMYAENPNVWEVDNARREYYRIHEFQKTAHTQYYKRWRRQVAPYINENGFVDMPTATEKEQKRTEYLQKRESLLQNGAGQRQMSGSWSCLGPFETFETPQSNGTQPPKSDQANVYSLDQSLSNTNVLYCGTETGMLFRSTDKAQNWVSVSNGYYLGGVTAVKIHPTNPDVVYAGDGSHLIKTTDGGNTWQTILNSVEVNDIAVQPSNPQVVLVATMQGLYRSTDGGANFGTIYSEKCYDIEWKPNDATVVYIVKNNAAQKRCEFFKSTNSGSSFTIQSSGWFNGTDANRDDGGARLTVTPADPNRVYAILIGQAKNGDNGFIGVYRSNDAGATWTLPNSPAGGPYNATTHPCLTTFNPDGSNSYHQGFYNLGIGASHNDANELYIGCLNTWKSTDGGSTFQWWGGYGGVLSLHPDVQDIKVYGSDIWIATDGGVDYSSDSFVSILAKNNGIYASDYWGFGTGWNHDILVGGRYHNGNAVYYETYPSGKYVALGGGEAATGYVNPGENRKVYHSDIGGTVVGATFSGPIDWFGVGRFPNESYYAAESSEMEFLPYCYNTWFLGHENKLWRTNDSGSSFDLVQTFGTSINNQVKQIEISRSNPNVMYVFQQPSSGSVGTLWKTIDGGANWTTATLPSGDSRVCAISLSATDANVLWIAFVYGSNGNKVFKTTNGGTNWSNITTSTLNGENIYSILHQGGTDGGVYLGTQNTVYYRNNSLTDWQIYADGLPTYIATDLLKPFYRDNKLRLASYGKGIWETPLYEASAPVAQPMVEKLISYCPNDSIQFEDYSILDHEGATWLWLFEGGSPSFSTERNPTVAYPNTGSFDVTLTVTNANGTHTKTVADMITIAPINLNSLPVNENFETTPQLTVINPDGGITWTNAATNCATNGATAYYVNCYNYGNTSETDDLLFPENLDLTNASGLMLRFRYAYAPYVDGGGIWTDTLRVLASNNCGKSFTKVFNKGGEDLSTTSTGMGPNSNYENTDWFPESCNDWQDVCLDLSDYAGQILQLKIQSRNGYGNNIFIDNISLSIEPLLTPTISGNATSCAGQSLSYTAPAGGSQYTWTVTGGTITNGQGTNTIQVLWNTPSVGNVSVDIVP
ncbi:MAG: PKD domain-containing protein [Chitinophagales bacterium]|nr:PKD domain-containing protein [Chitinophagales bacterium]